MNAEVHIRPGNTNPLKVGNKVFKSAYDFELTKNDLEKAARELDETDEKKEACLRELKKKLSEDSSFVYRQDDFYLLRYLRVRKYDVSKAFQSIKQFYGHCKKCPDLLMIPPHLKSTQELNFVTCLPYADEEGRIIFWLNWDKWNTNELSFEEIFQTVLNVCDIVSMNPRGQVNGIIAIHNMRGITLRHISELFQKNRLRIGASIFQNGYPWRIKNLFLLNTSRLVRYCFNAVKPLVRSKVFDRFVFLGSDMDELHQYVNPAILPKSLNGSLEDGDCDISQHILNNLSYLRYEKSFLSPSEN